MLSMVLINYAKFLKNISIRGIFYGAYEAKTKNDNGDACTPIWDLTPFAELQDWSIAAGEFIRHGKTADLVTLVEKDQPALATQLRELEQNILHCRGMELLQKTDYEGMKKTLADTRNEAIATQLQPLIEKIESKIEDFKNEQSTLHNGYAAVNWCVQHDMTQQGVTILQETMKTYLIEKYFGASNITKYPYRELVNGALWCRGVEKNGAFGKDCFKALSTEELDKLKIIYTEMLDFIKSKKKLSTLYIQLTNEIRNDINHGGFQEPYKSAGELKDSFHKLFTQIKALPL
jgi:CRISPR-associated (Cas) DxTHG family